MTSNSETENPLNLLLVESDLGDAALAAEAFADGHAQSRLALLHDGKSALAALREADAAQLPDVVLINLDLTEGDALEILTEIKSDDRLRELPVVVLADEDRHTALLQAYRLEANLCVLKPASLNDHIEVLREIARFFGRFVARPRRGPPTG
jgi:CheY-like chemotaxis protein